MSILAFYTYEGKGKILPTNNTVVKALVNPGAICTVDRVMVIKTSDTSFTLEEAKEVIEFVEQEKKGVMEINQQIRDLLDSFGINQEDGLSYLLSVYYECRPSYTPTILIQKINATNILGIGASRELIWNIPLFVSSVETDGKWDWVKAWNGLFGAINSKRKGSDKDCITRMKKFFAENPEVRKEDVIGATQLYIGSLTDRQYIISSHYFISKGVGRDRTSALEVWVERYQQEMSEIPEYTGDDLSTKMQ